MGERERIGPTPSADLTCHPRLDDSLEPGVEEAMKRCAVYLRVSTERQTVDNQREEVERMVVARGFEPVVYEEIESAAKPRPVLDRLMADASAGRVRAVAVWALDRMHRSMTGAINTVLELDRLGCHVMSVREGWLDTSGPIRPLLVAIFGWVAQQERERLIERTVAGLQRARRAGKHIGRPPTSIVLLRAAQELVERGVSLAAAARAKGISRRSLQRHLASMRETPSLLAEGNAPEVAPVM
jgi:putative DNA-invertase from lambdoid prophage Rac